MATVQSDAYRESHVNNDADPRTSSSLVPLLDESNPDSPSTQSLVTGDMDTETTIGGTKMSKRKFWNLGKKKLGDDKSGDKEDPKDNPAAFTPPVSAPLAPIATMRPASPLYFAENTRNSASPQRPRHPYGSPGSPARHLHSSSPRLHSPASSQIFERNVQEDVAPPQASPAIPSHIITENYIPSVLEASSAAITDDHLDPDTVEIITHAAHQPASVTVTGTGAPDLTVPMSASIHDDFSAHPDYAEDSASNYGTLDTNDVRRLSFISFADVVHAEQVSDPDYYPQSAHLPTRDSVQNLTGLSTSTSMAPPRSPSPMRSPVSSHGGLGTSPPTSVSAPSFKGVESSPNRGGRGGPGSPHHLPAHGPPLGGELNIETMRQALRKTGSGDLSGARSQPMSAVGDGDEEGGISKAFR